MKKFSLGLALALMVGSAALVSCSSKETRAEEVAMSPAAADTAPAESANLGGASSGQGR
jgi:hypothetical protein